MSISIWVHFYFFYRKFENRKKNGISPASASMRAHSHSSGRYFSPSWQNCTVGTSTASTSSHSQYWSHCTTSTCGTVCVLVHTVHEFTQPVLVTLRHLLLRDRVCISSHRPRVHTVSTGHTAPHANECTARIDLQLSPVTFSCADANFSSKVPRSPTL